jgi:hypothetical protein
VVSSCHQEKLTGVDPLIVPAQSHTLAFYLQYSNGEDQNFQDGERKTVVNVATALLKLKITKK